MGDPTLYRFRSEWWFAASPDAVYDALYEVADYPAWWPEVRVARKIDEDHYELTTRSLLPYILRFVLTRVRADRDGGLLEARMSGHLDGEIRWRIAPSRGGTTVIFEEDVRTRRALLDRLARFGARPAFRANHALMMRRGRAGLRTYLAGFELGRRVAGPAAVPAREVIR